MKQTAIAEWKKKDKKAWKEICLRISNEYLVYIDQSTTTPKLWTRLQGVFESKAAVGIVNLHCKFFRTFSEDGANMEEQVHMQAMWALPASQCKRLVNHQ